MRARARARIPPPRSPPFPSVAHYVHTRVHLRKGKNNQRVAKIYAGPMPEEEATIMLTEHGVVDVE